MKWMTKKMLDVGRDHDRQMKYAEYLTTVLISQNNCRGSYTKRACAQPTMKIPLKNGPFMDPLTHILSHVALPSPRRYFQTQNE